MYKQKSVMEKMLDAMTNTGDIMLRYQYQKNMMIENLLSDRELDKIADKVLERVTIKADISEIIKAFDEIEKRLDDFIR